MIFPFPVNDAKYGEGIKDIGCIRNRKFPRVKEIGTKTRRGFLREMDEMQITASAKMYQSEKSMLNCVVKYTRQEIRRRDLYKFKVEQK